MRTTMINAMTPENVRQSVELGVANDPRWARVLARDRTADGTFWYSVATTGVYCRPSCPSRAANPKNVQMHVTLADAKATGFRPCKRCHPDGPSIDAENVAIVARACRLIQEREEEPSLNALAKAVGRSASYFHRSFKAVTGLTPTRFKTGGTNEEIRFALGQTSLGAILVASSKKGVASILLGNDPDALLRQLQDRFPKAKLIGANKDYEGLVARVVGFIEAPQIGLDLPLDVRGTAFQRRVWQALQEIPVGQTVSYTEIAQRIGSPKAVRAVAGACAANNLAVAIPCHRVVRNDGSLSGYAWGVERKKVLLDREAALCER